jgi:YD repeat-containing protein
MPKLILGLLALVPFASAFADGIAEPIPSFYQEPGLSRTREYTDHHAREYIDPFTGKLQWHVVDLFIPGNGGMDLKVQRSYSSLNYTATGSPPEPSPVGVGWTMHYGRVLRNATAGLCDLNQTEAKNPVLELPDGSRQMLHPALDGLSFVSSDFWRAECNLGSDPGLVVHSPDGTRYDMLYAGTSYGSYNPWYTSKITDRNGNWMSIGYSMVPTGGAAVTSVTTSDGRSVTFNYTTVGGIPALSSVQSGGVTWNYEITATSVASLNTLTKVTRPDTTTWEYQYSSNMGAAGALSMTRATYPTKGTIDYTYGTVNFAGALWASSTVITQKVANPWANGAATTQPVPAGGGYTWNYTYTPATAAMPLSTNPDGSSYFVFNVPPSSTDAATVDQTTVTGPDDSRTYYHFGYVSASPGVVFYIGSLLGISSPVQNEAWAYAPIMISAQDDKRPYGAISDGATYAPLKASYGVGRSQETFQTSFSSFDGFGNPGVITESGSNNRTRNVSYYTDPSKWIIRGVKANETVTDDTGSIATTRTFDSNANVLTESRAGVTTTFTYTAEGDVATRQDAKGNLTSFSNYKRGIAQTESQPEGVGIARVVSDLGDVTSQTDGENATTGFGFDGLHRVTGITHPVGNAATVTWGAFTRTVQRGGLQELTTYDGFGVPWSVKYTGGTETITRNFQNDSLGRRNFASYANAATGTMSTFDMLGRPGYVFNAYNPNGSGWTSLRSYSHFAYKTAMTDERNYGTVWRYRAFGDPGARELVAIFDPLSNSENTTIVRNTAGQMASVTQDGVTRSYVYDSHYFLTSLTDPETGTTTMGRDAVGNMTSRQVGSSAQTTYGYDGRNRVTSITYPSGTPSVTKVYFKDDKVQSVDNGVAQRAYTYDANKNMMSETLTVPVSGGNKSFPVQYTYDGNDALASVTYGSGLSVNYSPDAFGRATQAGSYVTAVTYHPTGQPASFTYGNGIQTAVTLSPRMWPATLKANNGAMLNSTFVYDEAGNLTSIGDTVDTAFNRTLFYDPLQRLTGFNGGSIGYDYRGNILSQNLGAVSLTYAYDATTQRLTGVSGSSTYTMQYDAYGNVTSNGSTAFNYDDASNMRCAKCGGPDQILYDYDGAGQRVHLKKASGNETFFVHGHDGQLLWEETPGSSLKEYVYFHGKAVATKERSLQ